MESTGREPSSADLSELDNNGIEYALMEEHRGPRPTPDAIRFNEILPYAPAFGNKTLHAHSNGLFLVPGDNTPLCFTSKIKDTV